MFYILLQTSRRGTPRLYSWQNRILIHPLLPHWNGNFDTPSIFALRPMHRARGEEEKIHGNSLPPRILLRYSRYDKCVTQISKQHKALMTDGI